MYFYPHLFLVMTAQTLPCACRVPITESLVAPTREVHFKAECHKTNGLYGSSVCFYTYFIASLITDSENSRYLSPPYLGRLTFRGTISPSELVTVQPHLWITRPGSYSLSGWSLETEISIPSRNGDSNGRTKRYLQKPSAENIISVLVCNTQRSSDE